MTRSSVVVCLALFSWASTAAAQDALAAGVHAFERADFEGAVAAFDRAEASDELTREQLEQILSQRALAHHAAGDEGAADEDLSAWLSIAPDASFDDRVPPGPRRALERLRPEVAPLAVEAVALPSSEGFAVRARVTGDAFGLVRATRIVYVHDGVETQLDGTQAQIVEPGTLRYWVELVGPGGVLLASAGDRSQPLQAEHAGTEELAPARPPPSDDTALIVGVTIGAVLLAVGISILVGFLVAPPADSTQLGPPMRVMP